jgi:iron complex transport system substrate-binding protein
MSVFRFQSLGSTRGSSRAVRALFRSWAVWQSRRLAIAPSGSRAAWQLRCIAVALFVVACRPSSDAAPGALDDAGDPLPPVSTRSRIVSLVPATTEIIFALGAGDRVVGRTHWDGWPPEVLKVPDLGDGIRPSIETVLSARPDLVVLYATGDNRDAALALRGSGIAVISLRIDRIAEFERAAKILGDALGEPGRARIVVDSVRATLERVRTATSGRPRPTVFMLSWETPLMTIGSGSFLTELVDIAGGQNVFGDLEGPSPQVSFEEVLRRNPEYILGRPETAGKLGASDRWRGLPAVREGRVLVMDTVLVGRPGVRLGEAAVSIARLLHPGIIP